ncbi:MAG TPA: DUF4304 domain-containing protein [Symbiobacteriaceae bacterium]|jgi:hypothetical protein|nr:DUF4304 domain-containing protein [Symbiobacteriaceae bacterium]
MLPTAQERFALMMRDQVGPALRELGLRGSGQSFRLPVDDFWALVGFQKSVWNDATEVSFTPNLTVVPKKEWEMIRERHPAYPKVPSATTYYVKSAWQERIGLLMPDG